MTYLPQSPVKAKFQAITGKVGKVLLDYFKRADKFLWAVMLAISAYSLILLKTVPSPSESRSYFMVQLVAILAGYVAAIVITAFDYRTIARFSKWIALFAILLIVYTLIFGHAVTGTDGVNAKAWIKLPGGLTFQPSELVKILFMITYGKHLSIVKENGNIKRFLHVCLLGVHALVPILLVHFQGDDGAAIIFFFMFLFMSFAAGVQLRYFAAIFAIILIAIPIAWQYIFEDYQRNRILNMFNPEADPQGMGLQQIQGKISIGSGQFFGQGLFQGSRVQRGVVPIQESDFIFSVAGEQLGFIGCALIIVLLILLLMRTLHTARVACDNLGAYMCFGFFGMIASQMIFNLGMCLSLLPVMGVTLPFFSAGGSSAACLYLGFGLVQNIYMHRSEKDQIKIENVHRLQRRA